MLLYVHKLINTCSRTGKQFAHTHITENWRKRAEVEKKQSSLRLSLAIYHSGIQQSVEFLSGFFCERCRSYLAHVHCAWHALNASRWLGVRKEHVVTRSLNDDVRRTAGFVVLL